MAADLGPIKHLYCGGQETKYISFSMYNAPKKEISTNLGVFAKSVEILDEEGKDVMEVLREDGKYDVKKKFYSHEWEVVRNASEDIEGWLEDLVPTSEYQPSEDHFPVVVYNIPKYHCPGVCSRPGTSSSQIYAKGYWTARWPTREEMIDLMYKYFHTGLAYPGVAIFKPGPPVSRGN